MMNDKEILKTIKRLTEEHPDQLGGDKLQITQKLDQTTENDPEAMRRTANLLMKQLQEKHPDIWETFRKQIRSGEEGTKGATRLGYDRLEGDAGSIPAGTRMVCPESDCDYKRSLRQKGQRLFCPNHGTPLVPEIQSS